MRKNGYSLTFANGCEYNLCSDAGSDAWLNKFANIMQMQSRRETENDIKLVVTSLPPTPFSLAAEPRITLTDIHTDWKITDHSIIKIWTHPQKSERFYQLIDNPINLNLGEFTPYYQMQTLLLSLCSEMLESGSFPLHSAFLYRNNCGIAVSGPSGSGKTTCTKRIPDPWRALSDDWVLISPIGEREFAIQPLPTWSHFDQYPESSRLFKVHAFLPLRAIYLLEQSNLDGFLHISRSEAAARLYRYSECLFSFNWRHLDKDEVRRQRESIFKNVLRAVNAVPVYTLKVSKTGTFWKEIERSLRGECEFHDY